MKFTYGWLKEHLETDAPLGDILEKLTALGIEVEGVVDPAALLAPFVIAEIIEANPHPDADRLQVCTVNTGSEKLQVVCGAPNARAGMKGVFAPVGTTMPSGDLTLKKTKIRGVESSGMMCSARELGLGEDHDGIIELADDLPVGASYVEAAGLNDPLIDVAITPNRADCLGVYGIARDLAAAGMGTLKPLAQDKVESAGDTSIGVNFDFDLDSADACPLFVARTISGVKNGESPQWLKDRLIAVGLRPISALVDITNFFTIDRARPLHVFDADKLNGDLSLRLSKKGEKLAALDDKEYELDDGMTVIADDNGVLSLGGIIGGASTGCGESTVNVALECALFDPIRTATTGRRLGIESDARYRFERSVDPASVLPGIEAATAMILDLCGGEAGEPVITGKAPDSLSVISFRPARVAGLGGVEMADDEARDILLALGFSVTGDGDKWQVTPPSWRGDVEGEADLVEEVLRVFGYENIPALSLPRDTALPQPVLSAAQRRRGAVRRSLAARGLVEAVTWSFLDKKTATLFGGGQEELKLLNPISSDLDVMRPSALPNLAAAASRNLARGQKDFALFEIGQIYNGNKPEEQIVVASGLRAGATSPRHWSGPTREADAFDAKADALAALAVAGVSTDKLQIMASAPGWFHPGRSGVLCLGPKNVLAHFGELHPKILTHFDIKGPVAGFEIFLDGVPLPKVRDGRARPLLRPSPFQPVERDFAFVVDVDVAAGDVVRAAKGAERDLITDVTVFDVYAGKGVEPGKKSLALAVTLQPVEKTLTDDEIDEVAAKIVAAVAKATGGRLRS
ncbi:MAG: phenylalanine--tRNA ligase subunit beta [Rhodospirillaceae bacterium]|jgi:phenylalanyl-tRNA synthetase beta chain|nr:phenylalanine--tRNA ligase subunit beta [Rhodospirillaceae bacterium]MBT5659552.1 phenylalanine--tRNA ligase subunit beta [Rhodospirillaceae bacterium]MBT5751526.1 phenylalanine--tRNA ligase subunit beta [Rhodospirillaceae bacterium]